mmetsp:Transcript_48482/g.138573  ORF Transcript_48482/g.138573 Transcript_48482/m.138573 type:complete len:598 (+) Transcript_48482:57-1850(+)|eukprot:CAMPEP_0168507618 /NCGR_PEP_ID=MMETSP0228-20121227/77967_1 /TAXON_ID=133427 /ORGANISM="Protoceratium reticulatum, Strain CCCM 535 (=CCMP 1889)" /LENGTH=597 /DNA_ID=CAMNT_0008524717 /DNA_START=1 /DNA_END=1794 /DNA_ORIENTATION=-
MEVAVAKRRVPLIFPAALLPALAALLGLSGALGGAGGFALLRLLRARAREAGAVTRELSRQLSQRLLLGVKERRIRSQGLLATTLALVLVPVVRGLSTALRGSLALMNTCEEELDPDTEEQRRATASSPAWGRGLPRPPRPGIWRPFLHEFKGARENLEEVHGILGLDRRQAHELTLDQLTEGVRRTLVMKYAPLFLVTCRYWSRDEAESIALALAQECGLAMPLGRGGLEECTPYSFQSHLPWMMPKWLQQSQRLGIAALRPLFLHGWSWSSRYVETPFGRLHVYDAAPAWHDPAKDGQPPLLLQHGMFVTGWSMALLGWLLCRRGRRVIMPDLFDFDNGLSKSSGAQAGGPKVRSTSHTLEALMYVIRDILDGGADEVDLAGHSFGGWLVSCLASRCQREKVPVRKVVMLGPGGPMNSLNHTPLMTQLLMNPMETIDANLPSWMPASPVKGVVGCALGVLLSPNNVNLVFGLRYSDYFGRDGAIGSAHPTLLLWGDKDRIACPRRLQSLGPYFRARFPDIEAHWVCGGGHNIQLDSAVALARAMDAWLLGGGVAGGTSDLVETLLFPTNATLRSMSLPYGEEPHPSHPAGAVSRL